MFNSVFSCTITKLIWINLKFLETIFSALHTLINSTPRNSIYNEIHNQRCSQRMHFKCITHVLLICTYLPILQIQIDLRVLRTTVCQRSNKFFLGKPSLPYWTFLSGKLIFLLNFVFSDFNKRNLIFCLTLKVYVFEIIFPTFNISLLLIKLKKKSANKSCVSFILKSLLKFNIFYFYQQKNA